MKDLKAPAATVPIGWQRFPALFRACLQLGVSGKERFRIDEADRFINWEVSYD